jgi:peroxiredoxin
MNIFKRLCILLGIIGITSLAWVGGGYGSRYWQEHERSAKQESLTNYLLQQMGTMAIGDTLKELPLTYLDETPVRLSSLISERTLVMCAHPSCGACAGEVQALNAMIERGFNPSQVIIIIDGEMYDVAHFISDYAPKVTVLHDAHSHYISQYKISDTPFNLIVDSGMVIQDIMASAPGVSKLEDWFGL